MKLSYVSLSGFRGYRSPIRIDFGSAFTIIEGRNGVGKSTIFDAVEFALTGTLSKYGGIKADGETVADYIWWIGDRAPPQERYVEVGFLNGDQTIRLRRTQVSAPTGDVVQRLTAALCDSTLAPSDPLGQLVATTIIRDEHIASLSLDLKETDRYELLRSGLGSNDAEHWINRAFQVLQIAKKRVTAIQNEIALATAELNSASKRIDQVRATLVTDSVLSQALARLREFTGSEEAPDRLSGPVRERIALVQRETEALTELLNRWRTVEAARQDVARLTEGLASALAERDAAQAAFSALGNATGDAQASTLANRARDLVSLANLGRAVGLLDGHCPLCASPQEHTAFEKGLELALQLAREFDAAAAQQASDEAARAAAHGRLTAAETAADATRKSLAAARMIVEEFDKEREAQGVAPRSTIEEVSSRIGALRDQLQVVQHDLRILETLRFSAELDRAQRAEAAAKERILRLQERAGRARKAETSAAAIHDAARRAAAETLDRRLERVLPLMSELYRRLRPHPVWRDIEYSIRGDVKRFLKLKVGDELNPQFLFSSGQRRSTGLAFLLSVNMSLAWNRWRTVMLDDPVQHWMTFVPYTSQK